MELIDMTNRYIGCRNRRRRRIVWTCERCGCKHRSDRRTVLVRCWKCRDRLWVLCECARTKKNQIEQP